MSIVESKLHTGIIKPVIDINHISNAHKCKIVPNQNVESFIDDYAPTHRDKRFLHYKGGYLNLSPVIVNSGKEISGGYM
jgi:hypothetical protein